MVVVQRPTVYAGGSHFHRDERAETAVPPVYWEKYANFLFFPLFSILFIVLPFQTVRLQLWDTAGQERFRQLAPSYVREAEVAILVFDLTRKPLFIPFSAADKMEILEISMKFLEDNAIEQIVRWIRYVDRERGSETRVLLVGNKCDLKKDR